MSFSGSSNMFLRLVERLSMSSAAGLLAGGLPGLSASISTLSSIGLEVGGDSSGGRGWLDAGEVELEGLAGNWTWVGSKHSEGVASWE